MGRTMQKYVHKKGTVSLGRLIAEVKSLPDFYKAGAVAIFVGVVRGENLQGREFKS
jgi:hypothetical protein